MIWYRGRHISFAFEVEHTTAITEAVVRCSNIPDKEAHRVIVIPSERLKLLMAKVHEPLLCEHFKEFPWRILFYEELQRFVQGVRHRDRPMDAFQRMLRPIGHNPISDQMTLFNES